MTENLEIILCIPGKWKDLREITTSIISKNMNEYIFAGKILLHLPTSESFEIQIQQKDSRLRNSFDIAGQGRFSDSELDNIDNHTFVIYLIGKGGNQSNAEKVIKAGQAILNADGLGIKVETSGKAFTKAQWTQIINYDDESKFYKAFVVMLTTENNLVYSCGLHNIGLRDTICDSDLEVNEVNDLIRIFIYYQLFDKPQIESGQTFSKDAKSPVFRIIEEDCKIYDVTDSFFNPFGMYHLQAI
ncbi:MAG: DUF4261 domain-containing protein [Ferruginibacter sp.]